MLTRLLLLFSTLLFVSGGEATDTKNPLRSKSTAKQLDAQGTSKATDSAPQKVRMMFAGDIMSQLVQIESAQVGANEYSYDHCFRYMRPIFEQADLVVGNLECALMSEPPYTGYPSFKSPEQLAEALKKKRF